MRTDPVNITKALASFQETYSPRILASVNDYHVRIAHTQGEHVWHTHAETDEFFLVLRGHFDIALRDADGEHAVHLGEGDVFVVPQGVEHKPSSSGGAILMFEPAQTCTTGERLPHDVPAHVHSTTGRPL